MKTYNLWLILEETEDNDPVAHVETEQLGIRKNKEEALKFMEEVYKRIWELTD